MLKDHESCFVRGTDHEWEETSVGNAAAVLTANVDEDGSGTVPVLVTNPISLLIRAIVQEVEVVNQVVERLLFELVQVN